MNHRVQIQQVTVVVVLFGLLLASSPLAAAEWTQTDWVGGRTEPTLEVVTATVDNYYTGENENVLTAGKIILENKTLVESKFPTASGKSGGFIDNDNVLTSDDLYAKGTGVAGWVDHVVITQV